MHSISPRLLSLAIDTWMRGSRVWSGTRPHNVPSCTGGWCWRRRDCQVLAVRNRVRTRPSQTRVMNTRCSTRYCIWKFPVQSWGTFISAHGRDCLEPLHHCANWACCPQARSRLPVTSWLLLWLKFEFGSYVSDAKSEKQKTLLNHLTVWYFFKRLVRLLTDRRRPAKQAWPFDRSKAERYLPTLGL